jgi:hypothetical protein
MAGAAPNGPRGAARLRRFGPRLRPAGDLARRRAGHLFVPAEVPELVTLRAGAVAASILTTIWHILRDGAVYQDLGANHFHNRSPERQAHHLARQIAELGFTCSITPTPGVVSA